MLKGRVFQVKVQGSPRGVKVLAYGKSDRGTPRLLGHVEILDVGLPDSKIGQAIEQLLATIEGREPAGV